MKHQVIRAKSMGYCMGVDRAVKQAEEALSDGMLYSLGALIHNNAEIDRLKELGLNVVDGDDIPPSGSRAIIRAHGIHPTQRHRLLTHSVTLIDATCPLVVKNQKNIASKSSQGYFTIIVGKADHPEIQALIGFADDYIIINSEEEARNIKKIEKPVLIIAQTTLEPSLFNKIKSILSSTLQLFEAPPSICPATEERQEALTELVNRSEVVVVVGDHNSSNTKGLVNQVHNLGKKAFLVESIELPLELKLYQVIGLTAGASAPSWLIDAVESAILALD